MKKSQTKFKQTELGLIPEEWNIFEIQEIAEVLGGGTPSTKDEDNFNGDIPWITPRDLSNYHSRFISRGERNISEKGLELSNAKLLPAGSVLLTTRAPVGYLAIAQNEVTTNQGFHSLVPIKTIDGMFLYYLLSNSVQRLIDNASGSTFQELNGKTLRSLTFAFPEIIEQSRIASILSSLDDKIELNRQMNATLEKIASALFKKWFVDIDQNNLPEGWRVAAFVDSTEILGGGTPKTTVAGYWDGDIPWFSVVDAPTDRDIFVIDTEKKITKSGVENSAARILKEGTTIISARGTVGKVALIGVPMAINQSCYGLRGKYDKFGYFTYFNTKMLVSVLQNSAHGSVFDTITRETFQKIEHILPPEQVISSFEEIVHPLLSTIRNNLFEMRCLSNVRDSLLPRLMSGKIRV